MRLLFVLLLLSSLARSEVISVSTKMVCSAAQFGGTTETSVRCWSLDPKTLGVLLPAVPFEMPERVAASQDTLCALRKDKLQCFKYETKEDRLTAVAQPWFSKLAEPQLIAPGASGDFCAYDKARRMNCSHLSSFGGPFHKPYALALSNQQQICALDSQNVSLNCIGDAFRFRECAENMKKIYFHSENAKELVLPRGPKSECIGCVIVGDHVRCFGEWIGVERNPPYYTKPKSLALLRVDRKTVPCFIEKEKILCKGKPFAPYEGFTAPAAIDGVDTTHCAVNDEEFLCFVGENKTRIWHGLKMRFELATFEKTLKIASGFARARKAEAMKACADVVTPEMSDEHRHFVYVAIAPLLESIDSTHFIDVILPKYRAARAVFEKSDGKNALRDFNRDKALSYVALQLLRAATKGIDTEVTQEFTARLGMALGTKGDEREILELRKQYATDQKTWEALMENNRTRGNAILIESLVKFLE